MILRVSTRNSRYEIRDADGPLEVRRTKGSGPSWLGVRDNEWAPLEAYSLVAYASGVVLLLGLSNGARITTSRVLTVVREADPPTPFVCEWAVYRCEEDALEGSDFCRFHEPDADPDAAFDAREDDRR